MDNASNKIHQFKLKEAETPTLEKDEKIIDSHLENEFSIVTSDIKNGQNFFVTSWREKTIQAIDYSTAEVAWKITGEFEGKQIKPHGICCDDIGNLYVADGANQRILLVSADGKIEQKLTDMPGTAIFVGWLQSANRVVVHHRSQNNKNEEISILDLVR